MKKSAFSFIELSVVLLVIAAITIGIIQGSTLITNSRLSSARGITTNSKVNEIEGLIAWYETSLNESIDGGQRIDNQDMSSWRDISSARSISDGLNILTRSADSNVVYRSSGINNLPSLQFAASGRFSLTNLDQGLYSRYSVFAVLSPTIDLTGVTMSFIDSYLTGADNSISITSNSIEVDSGSTISLNASFLQSQDYVVGVYLSPGSSQSFVNDVVASDSNATLTVNGFEGLTVGADRSGANNFTGLMSEILVFNRILSEKERIMVMSYLSKKYNIRVVGSF